MCACVVGFPGVPEEERYEEDLGIIQNADEAEEGEPDQEVSWAELMS